MENKRRPFPLVADDEPVICPSRQMQLYENDDLITHIHGDYRDKVYQDNVRPLDTPQRPNRAAVQPQVREVSKAREEARKDIKKKRQVFVDKEPLASGLMAKQPVKSQAKKAKNDLGRFSRKLGQETYILAELPPVYTQPQNPSVKQVKKNNYDFLKKSQIYNKQDYQLQKEKRVAQELNLTRFEE